MEQKLGLLYSVFFVFVCQLLRHKVIVLHEVFTETMQRSSMKIVCVFYRWPLECVDH
jgi:hypothetical protein